MECSQTDAGLLPCPACGELTDSLKQYRYVRWCVFFLAGAVWQAVVYRACPTCMRQFIWRKCWINALPAHLVWVVGLLPWGVALVLASHRPGHSRTVLQGVTPEMAVAREVAQQELSWGRVWAVLSLLLFWLPLIGLATGALACWLNRRSRTWTYRASQVGLASSVVVHAILAVLFIVESRQW